MTQITSAQYMQIAILMSLLLSGSLSDSVFSVLLPSIQQDLQINVALSQWLFSNSILGFAFGMLFWGQLADYLGRRKAWNIGIIMYIITIVSGSLCQSGHFFMFIRLVQGFSVSVSNVMAMVVVRDWFHNQHVRSRAHALINQSFAFGPIFGYFMSTHSLHAFNWRYVYVSLAVMYLPVWLFMQKFDFKQQADMGHYSLSEIVGVLKTKRIQDAGLMIGISISLGFCYFSKMPYVFKHCFGFADWYPFSLLFLGLIWFFGGILAMKLPKYYDVKSLFNIGAYGLLLSSLLQITIALLPFGNAWQAVLYIVFSLIPMIGTGIIIPHAIGLGLEPFGHQAGKASAILGFSYYFIAMCIQCVSTFLSHESLLAMPVLFFILALIMLIIICNIDFVDKNNVD